MGHHPNRHDPPPTRSCHNCRRRRWKCDRSLPTCNKCYSAHQKCLGYDKLFRWTDSVASRGSMMGKTFAVTNRVEAQPALAYACHKYHSITSTSKYEDSPCDVQVPFWFRQLDDPVFRDLSRSSRFYLHYCGYTLRHSEGCNVVTNLARRRQTSMQGLCASRFTDTKLVSGSPLSCQ